jgi:uncharacterized protein (DUF1499 family)
MSLKDWLTKNMYVTRPMEKDPFFRPRRYARNREEVVEAVKETIGGLHGWRLEEYRENQGLLRASRSVLFPPSAQDIHIYVLQGADGTVALEMSSRSRGGGGDWGRNKRNVREFLKKMDARFGPPPSDQGPQG